MLGIPVAENLSIAVSWKKTVDISGLMGTKIIQHKLTCGSWAEFGETQYIQLKIMKTNHRCVCILCGYFMTLCELLGYVMSA